MRNKIALIVLLIASFAVLQPVFAEKPDAQQRDKDLEKTTVQDRVKDLEDRFQLIEKVLSSELRASNAALIKEVKESADRQVNTFREAREQTLYLFLILGGLGALLSGLIIFRMQREHTDYKHEREFFETRVIKHDDQAKLIQTAQERYMLARASAAEQESAGLSSALAAQRLALTNSTRLPPRSLWMPSATLKP
jgi:hypothetical protein